MAAGRVALVLLLLLPGLIANRRFNWVQTPLKQAEHLPFHQAPGSQKNRTATPEFFPPAPNSCGSPAMMRAAGGDRTFQTRRQLPKKR